MCQSDREGSLVFILTPERTENTTVTKESEVRNLPGTFLFILQNKVNETICKKVKGGVLLKLIKYKVNWWHLKAQERLLDILKEV